MFLHTGRRGLIDERHMTLPGYSRDIPRLDHWLSYCQRQLDPALMRDHPLNTNLSAQQQLNHSSTPHYQLNCSSTPNFQLNNSSSQNFQLIAKLSAHRNTFSSTQNLQLIATLSAQLQLHAKLSAQHHFSIPSPDTALHTQLASEEGATRGVHVPPEHDPLPRVGR